MFSWVMKFWSSTGKLSQTSLLMTQYGSLELRHRHGYVFGRDVLQHEPVHILVRIDDHAVEHAALQTFIGFVPGYADRCHAECLDSLGPDGTDGAGTLALCVF